MRKDKIWLLFDQTSLRAVKNSGKIPPNLAKGISMVFARKRFGQNFLQDQRIIEKIANALQINSHSKVIEIGPGRGALTQVLLHKLNQLTVIEIDRDLFALLKNLPQSHKLVGVCEDVLKVDFSQFGGNLHIIGNLPYNISTPLLFHLLTYRHQIQDMIFMLQKEVVDRILAKPRSENYGRLSVIFQYYFDLDHLFDVPPEAFDPIPKVESSVFAMRPKLKIEDVDFDAFEMIVKQAFGMRRKTLSNNMKPILNAQELQELGINPSARPQELDPQDFIKLTQFYQKHKSNP
jgi:16S rRNA (adenine1518-N6/adenine1519-N6)-dimethyltransferase